MSTASELVIVPRDTSYGVFAQCYRTGSTWLWHVFSKTYPELTVGHERSLQRMQRDPGIDTGYRVAECLIELWAEDNDLKIVHIVRDPAEQIRSACRHFGNSEPKTEEGVWTVTNEWLAEWENFHPFYKRYRIEDLWADPELLHDIADWFGLPRREELTEWAADTQQGANYNSKPQYARKQWDREPGTKELAKQLGYPNY